jgi:hypothetical protein
MALPNDIVLLIAKLNLRVYIGISCTNRYFHAELTKINPLKHFTLTARYINGDVGNDIEWRTDDGEVVYRVRNTTDVYLFGRLTYRFSRWLRYINDVKVKTHEVDILRGRRWYNKLLTKDVFWDVLTNGTFYNL